MLERNVPETPTAVRVKLAEPFTPVEAGAIHRLALRLARGTVIDLNFRDVRECQDVALLLLARDVLAGTAHYFFHGLTHHQATVLGYLGAAAQVTADHPA